MGEVYTLDREKTVNNAWPIVCVFLNSKEDLQQEEEILSLVACKVPAKYIHIVILVPTRLCIFMGSIRKRGLNVPSSGMAEYL